MSRPNSVVSVLIVLTLVAVTAVASAQTATLTVTPNPAPTGQQLRITLANNSTSTILMGDSGPWAIYDAANRFVFSPIVLPAVFMLPPGQKRWWTWDQKDRIPQQVAPGRYEVRLYCSLTPTGPAAVLKAQFTIGSTSTVTVSGQASPGGTVSFLLRSPSFVGRGYQAALSLGKAPGIPIGGARVLQLNPDPLFFASVTVGPPVFTSFAGQLDSSGRATARLKLPNIAQLRGVRFFAAFLVFHLAGPNGIAEASPAVQVVVQ